MLYAFKRLALGILLIALASAILLVADRERRAPAERRALKIAIFQHADSAIMEDGVRGMMDGLSARGYRAGEGGVTIDRFSAQGDMPTGMTIARQVTGGDYDLIITSSTPSMQAVANNNKERQVRHVFGLVADPFSSGVGLDRTNPLKHPPYMVGPRVFPACGNGVRVSRAACFPVSSASASPGIRRNPIRWRSSRKGAPPPPRHGPHAARSQCGHRRRRSPTR